MLEKLRYYRRRLRRIGSEEIELARLDSFHEIFERFLQLHRARWVGRGQSGVLGDDRVQNFHRDAAQRMLLSGTLRLYALRSRGGIIAALYGFAHRGHTYYYLSGFDPEFAPYSPGTLLIGHAIEEAVREGSANFDFLRGREAYKYLWGAKARLNYRRQLWPVVP
jgi:CelD/BcsL family acetyltransferase involved in cellulose biosynthesis